MKSCAHCRHSLQTLEQLLWCAYWQAWAGTVCGAWEREPGIEG